MNEIFVYSKEITSKKLATKAFEPTIFQEMVLKPLESVLKDGGFGDRTRPQETQWEIN